MINETPNGMHILLPWPARALSPNTHLHWAEKNRESQASKTAAFYLTKERNLKLDSEKHYRVTLVFCPPDRRRYDLDNLLASMKSALDGMCMALGIDDHMIQPIPEWGPLIKKGKVEVTIVEIVKPLEPQGVEDGKIR